jgi:hypothetical protein
MNFFGRKKPKEQQPSEITGPIRERTSSRGVGGADDPLSDTSSVPTATTITSPTLAPAQPSSGGDSRPKEEELLKGMFEDFMARTRLIA